MLGNLFVIAGAFFAGILFTVIIFRHDIFQVSDWDRSMPDLEDVIDHDRYPEQKGPGCRSAEKSC